jgi:hypothetical protein
MNSPPRNQAYVVFHISVLQMIEDIDQNTLNSISGGIHIINQESGIHIYQANGDIFHRNPIHRLSERWKK